MKYDPSPSEPADSREIEAGGFEKKCAKTAQNGKFILKISQGCLDRLTLLRLRTLTSSQNGHAGRLRGPR
jgi:hypothetical protein